MKHSDKKKKKEEPALSATHALLVHAAPNEVPECVAISRFNRSSNNAVIQLTDSPTLMTLLSSCSISPAFARIGTNQEDGITDWP